MTPQRQRRARALYVLGAGWMALSYWGVAYGNSAGEVRQDCEAVSVLAAGGKKMAWLMKSLAAARESVPMPELPERQWLHFIH